MAEAKISASAVRASSLARMSEIAGPRWEIYGDPDKHDHVDVEICYLLA